MFSAILICAVVTLALSAGLWVAGNRDPAIGVAIGGFTFQAMDSLCEVSRGRIRAAIHSRSVRVVAQSDKP